MGSDTANSPRGSFKKIPIIHKSNFNNEMTRRSKSNRSSSDHVDDEIIEH